MFNVSCKQRLNTAHSDKTPHSIVIDAKRTTWYLIDFSSRSWSTDEFLSENRKKGLLKLAWMTGITSVILFTFTVLHIFKEHKRSVVKC